MTTSLSVLEASLAALTPASPTRRGPACTVGAGLARLLTEHGQEGEAVVGRLAAKVDDADYSPMQIAQLLSGIGVKVSAATVRRHRNRLRASGAGDRLPSEHCACPA